MLDFSSSNDRLCSNLRALFSGSSLLCLLCSSDALTYLTLSSVAIELWSLSSSLDLLFSLSSIMALCSNEFFLSSLNDINLELD